MSFLCTCTGPCLSFALPSAFWPLSLVSSLRAGIVFFVLVFIVATVHELVLGSWQKFTVTLLNKSILPHYNRFRIDCILIMYLHVQDRIDTYTGDLHFVFC